MLLSLLRPSLRRDIVLGFLLLLLIGLAALLMAEHVFERQTGFINLVNTAGRLRAHSQRIAFLAHRIDADPRDIRVTQEELRLLIKRFDDDLSQLEHTNQAMGVFSGELMEDENGVSNLREQWRDYRHAAEIIATQSPLHDLPLHLDTLRHLDNFAQPLLATADKNVLHIIDASVADRVNLKVALSVLLLLGGMLLLVSFLYLQRRLLRPFAAISRMAERLAGGDFDARAQYVARGEVGDLVHRLNLTADAMRDLFARHLRAEEILQESDTRSRLILETSNDAVVVTDAQGSVTFANRSLSTIFGYSPEELIGKPVFVLYPQRYREIHQARMLEFKITGVQDASWKSMEIWALHKSGREIRVDFAVNHMPLPSGHFYVGFFRDLTHRNAVLADLRLRNRAIESTGDGIMISDAIAPNHPIIYVNPGFERITGYSHEEMLGQNGRILLGDDLQQPAAQELRQILRERREGMLTLHCQRKDGSKFWSEMSAAPVRDRGGLVTHYISVFKDVTERKQAEEALRIAATAFESREGMIITDADNVILRINRSFSEITGYSSEEIVGQTPRLLKSGRHDAAYYAEMWSCIRNTGAWQGEIWNRRKNGEVYPEWLMITTVKNQEGMVTHYVGTFTDITARKTAENEINSLAFYDQLTQLPNRRLLIDRMRQALASSARRQKCGALLFIDLDNFKTLNDTLGHDIGDLLLQEAARRLATCVREGDTVARLGGDEFVVMLEDLSEDARIAATQAETVGEKIIDMLRQPYQLTRYLHYSTASIGVTLFTNHQMSIDDLMKRADLAMYQAKAAGRNALRFFDPEMQAVVAERAELETDLREAVMNRQFLLYYQAQVAGEGCLTGAEVLLRWQHPQRGIVSPVEFIPLAEETGLILQLGHWVLETACLQLAAWARLPEMAHLTIAVNVSARQFHHRDFVEQVLAVLDQTGANPQRLKLELTESLLVDDVEEIIVKMAALKEQGVGFSLDDFGTGYSSLSYLKRLPLDQLKIDQGFVRNILTDPNDASIAKMVVALAESMGLNVIAEGVEIEAQRRFLASQGCQAYQGYLFSRPLPLEGFEAYAQRAALTR